MALSDEERKAAADELEAIETDLGAEVPHEARPTLIKALASGRLMWDAAEQAFTVQLLKPIDLKDVSIMEVEIREPTGGEIAKANKIADAFDQTIRLLSYITGHPVGYIERLGSRDLTLLGVVVGFFT